MIFSFARETVARIVELEPGLPATWLVGDPPVSAAQQRETIAQAIVARASALGFPKERVYPELVRLAHECGFLVFAWTANTISDMRFLLDVGVDGIITDRPDVLIELRGR
jgi:glycerophosphoryl diester phosphodiesterase